MPKPSGFRDEIVRYVTAELERVESNGGGTLTPLKELAKQYGLAFSAVYDYVKKAGLSERRARASRITLAPGYRDSAALLRVVVDEIERFDRGEIDGDSLSTYEQLAERSGFCDGYVQILMQTEGLKARRREVQRSARFQRLVPSTD